MPKLDGSDIPKGFSCSALFQSSEPNRFYLIGESYCSDGDWYIQIRQVDGLCLDGYPMYSDFESPKEMFFLSHEFLYDAKNGQIIPFGCDLETFSHVSRQFAFDCSLFYQAKGNEIFIKEIDKSLSESDTDNSGCGHYIELYEAIMNAFRIRNISTKTSLEFESINVMYNDREGNTPTLVECLIKEGGTR